MQSRSLGQDTGPYNSSTLPPSLLCTNFPAFCYTSCLIDKPNSTVFITFCVVNIFLLLPFCIFILRHGFQQWRRNASFSSAAAAKHSDCFTHHLAILELIGVFGCFICVYGVSSKCPDVTSFGYVFYSFTCYGETFFHLLMCLEHYLAAVYPVTYMGLRSKRGVLVRNVCISCAWLLCLTEVALMEPVVALAMSLLLLTIAVFVTWFCCLSVLCVLINPGPGKQSGGLTGRERLKSKAFYTILAILGVFIVRFFSGLLWVLVSMTGGPNCLALACNSWFNLPSSLVQPLLFLQRAGRCVCLKTNNK